MRVSFDFWPLVKPHAEVMETYDIHTPVVGVIYAHQLLEPFIYHSDVDHFDSFPTKISILMGKQRSEIKTFGYLLIYYNYCKCLFESDIAVSDITFDEFSELLQSQHSLLDELRATPWYASLLEMSSSEMKILVNLVKTTKYEISYHSRDKYARKLHKHKSIQTSSIFDLLQMSIITDRFEYATLNTVARRSKFADRDQQIALDYTAMMRDYLFGKNMENYVYNLEDIASRMKYDMKEVEYVVHNFQKWESSIRWMASYLLLYNPTPLFYKYVSFRIEDPIISKFYVQIFKQIYQNIIMRLRRANLQHYSIVFSILADSIEIQRNKIGYDYNGYYSYVNCAVFVIGMCRCGSGEKIPTEKIVCKCDIHVASLNRINLTMHPDRLLWNYYNKPTKHHWDYLVPYLSELPTEIVDDLPKILIDYYVDETDYFSVVPFTISNYLDTFESNQKAFIWFVTYIYQSAIMIESHIESPECNRTAFNQFIDKHINNNADSWWQHTIDSLSYGDSKKIISIIKCMSINIPNLLYLQSRRIDLLYESSFKIDMYDMPYDLRIFDRITLIHIKKVCSIFEEIQNIVYDCHITTEWDKLVNAQPHLIRDMLLHKGYSFFNNRLKQFAIKDWNRICAFTDVLFIYFALKAPTPAFYKIIRQYFRKVQSNGVIVADIYVDNFVRVEKTYGHIVRDIMVNNYSRKIRSIYHSYTFGDHTSECDPTLIQLLECECGEGVDVPPHLVDCKCHLYISSRFH